MIVAIDYDGVIYRNGGVQADVLNLLRSMQLHGDKVILWTCREGRSLQDAVAACRACGFMPDAVNANVPEGVRRLGHDSRKVYADVYVDDRNGMPSWLSS